MAKKSAARGSREASPTALKRDLEKLDRELLKMLGQRAKLYLQLARTQTNGAAWDLAEDQQVLGRAVREGAGSFPPEALAEVFREILSACRSLAKPIRVAYLGPEYSYSHLATRERFGSSALLAPVATISAVFEEVQRGHADFGMVPLENSTDGRVVDTLDMFAKSPVRICGEVQLRIHHNLLAKCPRDQISEVFSKPQALSQCRGWLAKHLPVARTVEMTSTARAAQIAADKEGAAAIASLEAGAQYGLEPVATRIEDNKNNITRFVVIGGQPARRTGRDKTALMFQIAHQPGALADAMAIFKRNRLNLTWIESFPLAGARSEYLFFVEFEGHESDSRVRRALDSLGRRALRLTVLGSYPTSEPKE